MERRSFLSFLGLGAAAVLIPVTTAAVMLFYNKEKKPPSPIRPIPDKTNWKPVVGVSTGPYYRPTLDITDENMTRVQLTVGEDGCLWIRPHSESEWYRVALESNYV